MPAYATVEYKISIGNRVDLIHISSIDKSAAR